MSYLHSTAQVTVQPQPQCFVSLLIFWLIQQLEQECLLPPPCTHWKIDAQTAGEGGGAPRSALPRSPAGEPTKERGLLPKEVLFFSFQNVREPFSIFWLTGSEFKHRTLDAHNPGPIPRAQGTLPAPGVRVPAQ